MCFSKPKAPKIDNPAQVQVAAPTKANPLRLSQAARSQVAGQGVGPSALRIPLNAQGQAGAINQFKIKV